MSLLSLSLHILIDSIFWGCAECSMVPLKAVFVLKSVDHGAPQDARQWRTRSRACSSAKNATLSACVCLQALTETSKCVPATIIGRPRKEAPNALRHNFILYLLFKRKMGFTFAGDSQ
ncbi:hypothetical protein RJ641_007284 [Dillenia turbinata]|uniref:Secreted protein n=1 Tax=Dillenia turbinata TaxID=194707 RepID=A0AAN8V150_9MAGN